MLHITDTVGLDLKCLIDSCYFACLRHSTAVPLPVLPLYNQSPMQRLPLPTQVHLAARECPPLVDCEHQEWGHGRGRDQNPEHQHIQRQP